MERKGRTERGRCRKREREKERERERERERAKNCLSHEQLISPFSNG